MTQAPTPGPLSSDASHIYRETSDASGRLAPTAPVEASGSERESEAWEWLGQLYPNDAPSDLAYDANEMIDAFLAGSGRSDRMAKALERIAGEQQYRSGYCQTDITVEPALSADEAQTVAREALAHNPALRPQPSGETREQLAAIMQRNIITNEDGGFSFHDLKAADEILSLIRPAPVGGEGCKGCGHVEPVPDGKIACCPDGKRYATTPPTDPRLDRAIEALEKARAALHQHYVDWDGEPEDAVPLQLARSECDQALASIRGEA